METEKAATSHDELMRQLADSRIPKTEREHAAQREIERLRDELAQVRAYANTLNERCIADAPDAERYRWLRDNPWPMHVHEVMNYHRNVIWDTTIDAVMKEAK